MGVVARESELLAGLRWVLSALELAPGLTRFPKWLSKGKTDHAPGLYTSNAQELRYAC